MMRFVPGFLAAAAAFAALKLLVFMDAALTAQIVLYLLVYLGAAVAADFAMKRYRGRGTE